MTKKEIWVKAEEASERCGSREPHKICKARGINVMHCDLGSLKSMSMIIKRNAFIALNENLSPRLKRTVLAHELGHLTLHRELIGASSILCRCTMMHLSERPEYEANLFAAILLINRRNMLALLGSGYCFTEAVRLMNTEEELIRILFDAFDRRKSAVRGSIELPRAGFLR